MTQDRYSGTDNLEVMAEAVNYNRFLLDLVSKQLKPGQRIVDFGAGIGTFALALAQAGHAVTCVEPDPRQAGVIAQRGIAVVPDIEQIEDASVDVLYTLNVLEHIEDDAATIRAFRRKLRPRGRLLIYVPAFQVLYSSMDRKVGHLRRYTRGELRDKVAAAGFRIQHDRYADSAGFVASLLFRFFGNDSGAINRSALIAYDRLVFPLSRVADRLFGRLFGKNLMLLAVPICEAPQARTPTS